MAGEEKGGYPRAERHSRCGATLVVAKAGEMPGEQQDCPVCREVGRVYRESGGLVNRASAGTPLFEELGGVVLTEVRA